MTSPRQLLLPIAGFTVWGAAFLALYGVLSLGCRLQWEEVELVAGVSLQRMVLVTTFALHLLLLGALTWWTGRRWRKAPEGSRSAASAFLASLGFYASMAALAATIFNFAAVFWLTSCDTQQAYDPLPSTVAACPADIAAI